jgi:hypothetical protein
VVGCEIALPRLRSGAADVPVANIKPAVTNRIVFFMIFFMTLESGGHRFFLRDQHSKGKHVPMKPNLSGHGTASAAES